MAYSDERDERSCHIIYTMDGRQPRQQRKQSFIIADIESTKNTDVMMTNGATDLFITSIDQSNSSINLGLMSHGFVVYS